MQEFIQPRIGSIYSLVKQHLQFFGHPHSHKDVMREMYTIRDALSQNEQKSTILPQKRRFI